MELLELALKIGYEIAKKEPGRLTGDLLRERALIVADCFQQLDEMGYTIARKNPSWETLHDELSEIGQTVDELIIEENIE